MYQSKAVLKVNPYVEKQCTIHFNNEEVQIFEEGEGLIIWKISSLTEMHFNSSVAEFTYKNSEFPLLIVPGESGLNLHHLWSIQNDPDFIRNRTKRQSKGFKLFLTVCLLIVAVLLGIYFILVPHLAEKAVDSFSIETEIQLGSKMGEMYEMQVNKTDSCNYYLQTFLDAIGINSPYPLSLQLIESNEINAFAVPGGKMFIYSGLLKQMNQYEQLVALIGHESSHVRKRHSLKSLMKNASSSIALSIFLGDVSGISSGLLAQADHLNQLAYSRDLETEADSEGLKLMEEKGVNPSGMIDLLNILLEATDKMGANLYYLNSHPDTEARIDAVTKKMSPNKDWKKNTELSELFIKLRKHLKD